MTASSLAKGIVRSNDPTYEDGRSVELRIDATGALVTTGGAGTGGATEVQGDVAHDDPDSGNPVKIGAVEADPTSLPASTADGDRTDLYADNGRVITYEGVRTDPTNDQIGIGAHAQANGMEKLFDSSVDNTAQVLTANPGNLYKVEIVNGNNTALNGAPSYLQIFDAAAGSVTVGTTTPDWVIPVPTSGFTADDFDTPLTLVQL